MIKLRIQGLPDETTRFVNQLSAAPGIRVLETSNPYPNRPPSELVRCYISLEFELENKAAQRKEKQ